MNPLAIVPEQNSELVGQAIKARLPALVDLLRTDNLAAQMSPDELGFYSRLMDFTAAHELLLWARAERSYGVAWTSLSPEEEVIGAASAGTEEGLVWKVFVSGRSGLQTAEELQASGWTNLEKRRGRTISRMGGSPVFAGGKCVAVLTLVQYEMDELGLSLGQGDATLLAEMASLLGRSLENELVRASLGMSTL